MSGSVVVCAVNEKTPPNQTPPTNTMVTIDSANTTVIALDLRIALIQLAMILQKLVKCITFTNKSTTKRLLCIPKYM